MLTNRSMPHSTVIPVLAYPNLDDAVAWLVAAFGFRVRLRIASHRVQMHGGDGSVVLTARPQVDGHDAEPRDSVMIRVEDVDAHHRRATAAGARIIQSPTDFPYGERQYSAADPFGRVWSFSQTIADVAPEDWGGTLEGA